MSAKFRIAAGLLSLSMVGFVAITQEEGYTDHAVIPVKGDRPTLGHGSTFHEDGSPVKMGDRTTPTRALVKAQAHISREEAIFRKTIETVPLQQAEYDLYMDWVYQYGTGNWSRSPMRRHLNNLDYKASCDALLQYRFVGKRDCALPENWGPRGCRGVWLRQQRRHDACMALL